MRKLVSIAVGVCIVGSLALAGSTAGVAQSNVPPEPPKQPFKGEALAVEMMVDSTNPVQGDYYWFLQQPRTVVLQGRLFLVGKPVAAEDSPLNSASRIWLPFAKIRSLTEYQSVEVMRKAYSWLLGKHTAAKKTPHIKSWGDIIDPDRDCRIKESDGTASLTIPGKHHDLTYTDEYTKLNSPRILKSVDGDFALRVMVPVYPLPGDVASSGGNHSFVSTGLLLWQDEKNFIRLERAAIAGSPAPFVWFEQFKDGKSVASEMKAIADTDTGLQIARKGNGFNFAYKDGDNKVWAVIHHGEIDMPGKIQAGALAINSTAREFSAQLTGLEMNPKK